MIVYHRTSLLESNAQTVVNTVNTVGVMGKGIAQAFKKRHPNMFEQYKRFCDQGMIDIGKLWLWKDDPQWILNFPTKRHWRYPSKLEYVEAGLHKFVERYENQGIREVAFPKLGCGNGGLPWSEVEPLMRSYLDGLPIRIYIHDHDVDLGVVEHNAYTQNEFANSFHDFVCDLKNGVNSRFGEFATIVNKTPFYASFDEDNSIVIKANKKRFRVDEFDLHELWVLLKKGPVDRTRMTGTAREGAYYLMPICASLSYLRAVSIAREPSEGSIAIETTGVRELESVVAC
jgi:O-acetyl-ADP-ribose deacetylase (regulator of RNase III)